MGNGVTELAEKVIKEENNDDIVGFIGLSQGGCLAGLVSANYKRLIPSLKFGISYSGFYFPSPFDSKIDKSVYDGKVEIPFLSVIGEQDTVVLPAQTQQFADEQVEKDKSTVYSHNGGHEFGEDDESIKYVIDWIEKVL